MMLTQYLQGKASREQTSALERKCNYGGKQHESRTRHTPNRKNTAHPGAAPSPLASSHSLAPAPLGAFFTLPLLMSSLTCFLSSLPVAPRGSGSL
jgi:hypothetical protein